MSGLSLNWKRLSSQLLSSKKLTKKVKDAVVVKGRVTKSIPKNNKTIANKEKLPPKVAQEEPLVHDFSPLELTLWSKENEITSNDIKTEAGTLPIDLKKDARKQEPGKYLAIDCEFVGVGPEGRESALARVSVVNFYGHIIYDTFVKPKEFVVDWRTWVSGITSRDMNDAKRFEEAQLEVSKLLDGKILVGHAVHNDLESLFLSHPKLSTRDTSQYLPFRKISSGKAPSLKKLTQHFLNINIQDGSHSSVEDARATMLLFRLHRTDFEKAVAPRRR